MKLHGSLAWAGCGERGVEVSGGPDVPPGAAQGLTWKVGTL